MVDLGEIQAAYYMVAATGVLVAAGYYILNMWETTKNRRITLTTTLMQHFMTEEGMRHFIDLMNMQWTDLEDFSRRYDSRVNSENFAKRMSMWNLCENIGGLYRDGLIDLKTLSGSSLAAIEYMWIKFKPVIEMFRGTDFGPRAYENLEYIAGRLSAFRSEQNRDSDVYSRMNRVMQGHGRTT